MTDWRDADRPDWALTKWEQVRDALRARIEDGTYPPKTRIPSIDQIAIEFDVARNTARHAVAGLADDGLVRPLRSLGTYVVPPGERVAKGGTRAGLGPSGESLFEDRSDTI